MDEEVKKEFEQVVTEVKEETPVNATPESVPQESHVIETDSSDDEFESGEGLLTGAKYDVPDSADKFVDTKDGTVVDKKDLTPFQMIKAIAKQNNQNIKDPDKGCRKCYGRGYEGLDSQTKMPIPCRCLFRGKTASEKEADTMYDAKNNPGKIGRNQKRRMQAFLLKQYKLQRKVLRKANKKGGHTKEVQTPEQKTEYSSNILKVYSEVRSLKKAAKKLNITLTELKKVVKKSRSKPETSVVERIEK